MVDNIKMDLQEVGCGHVDWIGLAQDRDRWRTLVSAVMNLRVPWNAGNFLTSCKPVSCLGRTLHHGVSKLCLAVLFSLKTVCEHQLDGHQVLCIQSIYFTTLPFCEPISLLFVIFVSDYHSYSNPYNTFILLVIYNNECLRLICVLYSIWYSHKTTINLIKKHGIDCSE